MNVFHHHLSVSRRAFLMLGTGCFAALAGEGVARAMSAAEQYVAGVGGEVIRLANSGAPKPTMRRRFSSLVNRYANVRLVGLLALGPYQKQLPADRQQEYFRLIADYIAAFFVYYLDDFRGSGLDIKSSVEQGRSTIVQSQIRSGGRNEIHWRITAGRVSDVKVSGVWLSLQLKKRFTDILRRTDGDFEPVFDELKSAASW